MTDRHEDIIAVPVRELEKLEEARKRLYQHLSEHVGAAMLLRLLKR